jgi:hypothetical protein
MRTLLASLVAALTLSTSFVNAAPRNIEEQRMADPVINTTVNATDVRAALAQRREQNLAAFHAYRTKGIYPHNTYQPGKLNVWTDQEGHICAAATIIKASGYDELVQQTAVDSNFIRLGDVKQGELMEWILTSGLTQDEIATIQEPFMEVPSPQEQAANRRAMEAQARAATAARKRQDARLAKRYATIERLLASQTAASLDAATARIMNNQELAARLVAQVDTLPEDPDMPVVDQAPAQPMRFAKAP